jgi:hypothetical protein
MLFTDTSNILQLSEQEIDPRPPDTSNNPDRIDQFRSTLSLQGPLNPEARCSL